MPHRTFLARRDLKMNDPEKYEKFREACRKRDDERNARKREMNKKREISAEEFEKGNEGRLERK